MRPTPARRSQRRRALLTAIALLSTALWLTAAAPAFACSCVGTQPMDAYATAEHAIFAGTAGPSDARGVPVRVSQWFSGPGAAAVVYLASSSFGDGASCGTTKPGAGTEWVWIAWLPPEGGDPTAGLCTPHAQLGTPEGTTLLADVTAAFGGAPPPGSETEPPGAAPNPPVVPPEAGVPIVLITVGLGLAVLLGAIAVARRRPRAPD